MFVPDSRCGIDPVPEKGVPTAFGGRATPLDPPEVQPGPRCNGVARIAASPRGRRHVRVAWLFVLFAALAAVACGPPTKHEILNKAEGVATREDLEAALGPPSDRNKLGPIETWTYEASDGEVEFVILGDRVRLQAAGSPAGKSAEEAR
jgi:hypothetical protein